MSNNVCNRNSVMKYVRIGLSLAIIAIGIITKNWVGLLGLITLYTAFTGKCGASIKLPRKNDIS